MVNNYTNTYITHSYLSSSTYTGVRGSVQWEGNNCSGSFDGWKNYRGLPRTVQGSDGKRYYKWSPTSLDK